MINKELLKNKWLHIVTAFAIGAAIGVIFYPSKSVEQKEKIKQLETYTFQLEASLKESKEKLNESKKEISNKSTYLKTLQETSSQKIESLRAENNRLQKSAKRQTYKLIKPDGTIIEKEYEESKSEEVTSVVTEVRQEFDRKVQSIENKWKSAYEKRLVSLKEKYEKELKEKEIETKTVEKTVEKEKTIKINEKKLRAEIGYSSQQRFYTHATYSIWGPMFLGGGISVKTDKTNPQVRIGLGIEL